MHNKYNNKKFVNSTVKRYIETNSYIIKQRMQSTSTIETSAAVDLYIYVYPPDNRIRDKDNILKCIFDTIKTSTLIKDDSQIKNLSVFDCGVKKNGACIIFFIMPHAPQSMLEEYYNYYFDA